MRLSIIFLLSAVFFLTPLPAVAGNTDSPAPPDDPASAVFTFEDLYNRLLDGTPGEKRTGPFSEPESGPGNYGHSINEIMSIAPAPESGNAASPENVPEGMIFWCVDPAEGRWGKQTGTMPNQGAVNITPGAADQTIPAGYHNGSGTVAGDENLVPENIAGGKTVFGVAGSAAVATGDAVAGDVLAGKTFSKTGDAGLTGTMPDNGAVNITPGTANQSIPAGYHNGSGTVAGDANLVSGNIRSGATVFGVAGNSNVADTGTGTAAAGDILSGKTAFVKGATVTGTVPAGNNVTGTSGSLSVTIPDGLYSGSKTAAANDTNLVSGNIRSGAGIFGVSGSVIQASGNAAAADVLIGKTFSNAGAAGVSGTRYPSPVYTTGQTFTDNGDGTVTDNRTGLMWMKNADLAATAGYDPDSPGDSRVSWNNAVAFIAGINSGAYTAYNCGYTDWRLPHIKELFSLTDMANFNPALPSGHPFSNVQPSEYWSATADVSTSVAAWYLHLSVGLVYSGSNTSTYYVWPVRGGQ